MGAESPVPGMIPGAKSCSEKYYLCTVRFDSDRITCLQGPATSYAIVTTTSLPLSATATREAGALFAEISRKPLGSIF